MTRIGRCVGFTSVDVPLERGAIRFTRQSMRQQAHTPNRQRAAAIFSAPWLHRVYAVCLAAMCFGVLAAHVQFGFERIRVRLAVPRTSQEATTIVALPDLTRLAGLPVAIVARLRGGLEPTRLTVTLDETPVAAIVVPAHDTVRLDAQTLLDGGVGHELRLSGNRTDWQVDYLEIGNAHGYAGRLFSFGILPRGHPGAAVPVWLAGLIALSLLVLRPRVSRPTTRLARVALRVGVGLVLFVFGLTMLADEVTPYKIVLSPAIFLLGIAVLYADFVETDLVARGKRALPLLPHAVVALLVLWAVAQFYQPTTGFTRLIMFGREFEPLSVPALHEVPHAVEWDIGYDGQFYAQLALDPLLRDPATAEAVDGPAYRGRRIFLPWVAYVLGLGQPWFVIQAYALLNVFSWALLAWLLLRWLPPGSVRATLAWTACVLTSGLLESMRESLTDGPSVLLIALGIAAIETNRRWLAAITLGISGLARETNLLSGVLVLPFKRLSGRPFIALAAQALVVLLPLTLWIAYLAHLGFTAGSGPRNFAMPLSAYAGKWTASIEHVRSSSAGLTQWLTLLGVIALTTQGVVLAWIRDWRNPWWRVGASYAALMLVLGPAVWEGEPGAITRLILPMTIAFNVLLPTSRWFWPLWVLGNINLAQGPVAIGLDHLLR